VNLLRELLRAFAVTVFVEIFHVLLGGARLLIPQCGTRTLAPPVQIVSRFVPAGRQRHLPPVR
jgi:hypothetical protein